jgi:chemosensory pili system protein ChpA (sensor histidine kinase/response regulator)
MSREPHDLSPLGWVHDELRQSLDRVGRSLRESPAGVTVPALRAAQRQFKQGAGALEMIGRPSAAALLKAAQAVLAQCADRPERFTARMAQAIERASTALLRHLAQLRNGELPASPLAMFSAYQALQGLAGAGRAHPADLWDHRWVWRYPAVLFGATPRLPDAMARSAMEVLMLMLMRAPSPGVFMRMSELCDSLAGGAHQPRARALWQLASGMFEAQASGLLPSDEFTRQLAPRLMSQLRAFEGQKGEACERLAQDLLFFCAHAAEPSAGAAQRLLVVRAAWGLSPVPVPYSRQLLQGLPTFRAAVTLVPGTLHQIVDVLLPGAD